MNAVNYSRQLEEIAAGIDPLTYKPRLLLHSCCAPCSSYCLVYLRKWFDITCFFYNPNITDAQEYDKRAKELKRLADTLNSPPEMAEAFADKYDFCCNAFDDCDLIKVIEGEYDSDAFFKLAHNLEDAPEGGERCRGCFGLRMSKSCEIAAEGKWDYVTTTLTISPLKNAALINEIGIKCAERFDVKWLPSDFKKKDGYKKSIELSAKYNLYRQNYCGCVYSIN